MARGKVRDLSLARVAVLQGDDGVGTLSLGYAGAVRFKGMVKL